LKSQSVQNRIPVYFENYTTFDFGKKFDSPIGFEFNIFNIPIENSIFVVEEYI
tara:strand:+ start:739 stop:897 length:159 start_codon:yes stop_codon:yes gene_type:complete